MFHLIPIVFQSCKRKGNMSPTKQSILESMEGEMKNLDDRGVLAGSQQRDLKFVAEVQQRDVSQKDNYNN